MEPAPHDKDIPEKAGNSLNDYGAAKTAAINAADKTLNAANAADVSCIGKYF